MSFSNMLCISSLIFGAIQAFPFEPPKAQVMLNGSVSKTLSCHRDSSGGLLITPSFPLSGSGWLQTLLYSSLNEAGVTGFHAEGKPHFGLNSFYVGEKKFEWLFTHESNDDIWSVEGMPIIEFPDRPVILFRVVRSALYNIESFYRYSVEEKAKVSPDSEPLDFDRFTTKAIREYRQFHGYYTTKCKFGNEGEHTPEREYGPGHMTDFGEFPSDLCCIDVTFEDLQNKVFIRELLRKLLEMWIGEYIGAEAIWRGVERATRYLKPLHADHGAYASGQRYTAAHFLKLAELGIQD